MVARTYGVLQDLNRDAAPSDFINFENPESAPFESFADADGTAMRTIVMHGGGTIKYHCLFPQPIAAGAPLMANLVISSNTMITKNPDGTRTFVGGDQNPLPPWPTRMIRLYRFPAGATVIATEPVKLPQRVVDGRVQIYRELVIPPNGLDHDSVQYKLSNAGAR
jgi:hypothetical protein